MSQQNRSENTLATPDPETGRAELRRAAFLRAAREVFIEFGYEHANMAEIVRRAGGSLSTLYAQFGGKKGLFEAMIDSRVSELTEQMHVELAAHAPIREGLRRIGEAFLSKQATPESLDMFRLMVTQAKAFPDMVQTWRKRGPDVVRKALATYLEDRAKAGEIKIADYDTASQIFIDLVRSRILLRAMTMPKDAPSEQEIRDAVDRAVKVFLGGIEAL